MREKDLEKYTFLAWVKSGLGSGLYGPGDIQNIEKSTIIRKEPRPGNLNVESNYFALVESSQGDFFWRFTPAMPNTESPSKLTPWLTLIVLSSDEFEGPVFGNILPQITVTNPKASLPDLSQAWAWAHCQITEEVSDSERIIEILRNEPYKAISRLLCPRELTPDKNYHAFLVPTFKAGRLASIEESIRDDLSGEKFAWDLALPDLKSITMGYYDSWQFSTGPEGDFRELIKACVLDENIAIRDLDLSKHNFALIPNITKPLTLGGHIFLLIKGEFLRHYPRFSIYAVHGIFHTKLEEPVPVLPTIKYHNTDEYIYEDKAQNILDNNPEWVKDPIFWGTIEPDIAFFGFEIPPNDVKGELDKTDDDMKAGWFFLIQQQVSEPKFGLDVRSSDGFIKEIETWNDVSWDHVILSESGYINLNEPIEGIEWVSHAGDVARCFFQLPVRVAVHGSEMVKE